MFLCSSLEIEGQGKAPFFLSSRLVVYLFDQRAVLCLSVCVWERGRKEGKSGSPTQGERDRENKLVFTVLSQRMGGLPVVQPNYEQRN